MKRQNHWFYKFLFLAYAAAIVWTSVAYAIENEHTAKAVPYSPERFPVNVTYAPHGPRGNVQAYVVRAAKAGGVDPRVAEWIVAHESSHHPEAIGDGGASRGLWQINKDWHPEVSDACAYSVPCSTRWSLARIRSGYADEWSTWKYCRAHFDDCPFKSQR